MRSALQKPSVILRLGLRLKSAPSKGGAAATAAAAVAKPVKAALPPAEAAAARAQLVKSLARNVVRRLAARPSTIKTPAAPAHQQAALEQALLDYVKMLPAELQQVKSSITDFGDMWSDEGSSSKSPFHHTPEYQRYQKARIGCLRAAPCMDWEGCTRG